MTCRDCQEQIFEGELSSEARAHAAECAECGVLEREARLNALAMAEMRDEAMPAVASGPVFARKSSWQGIAAVAAAAAIAAAVGMQHDGKPPVPEPLPPPPPIVATMPPVPAPVFPGPPAETKAKARRARAVQVEKPGVEEQKAEEPMLVKFLTDDPEVVIYWLIDPVQGEQAI